MFLGAKWAWWRDAFETKRIGKINIKSGVGGKLPNQKHTNYTDFGKRGSRKAYNAAYRLSPSRHCPFNCVQKCCKVCLCFQGDDSVVACLSNGKVAISYNPEKNNRRIVDELIVSSLFLPSSPVGFQPGRNS